LLYCVSVGSPPPVTNLRVIEGSIGCTSATISWNEVFSYPVCGSLIYLITRRTSSGITTTSITGDTSFHFDDLNSTTSYTITVAGSNDAGVGESSNVIVITTSQELIDTELNGEFIYHNTRTDAQYPLRLVKSHPVESLVTFPVTL